MGGQSSVETLERLERLAERTISEVTRLIELDKRPLSLEKLVCYYLLSKTITSFKAIRLLLRYGYDSDAAVLMRTIAENLINLRYINQDPEHRVPLFINHLWVVQHEQMQYFKERNTEEDFQKLYPNGRDRIIESKYKEVEKDYRRRKHQWTPESVLERAEECNLPDVYKLAYKFGSNYCHGTFDVIESYVKLTEDGVVYRSGGIPPGIVDYSELVLKTTVVLLGALVEEICSACKLSLPPAAKDLAMFLNQELGI